MRKFASRDLAIVGSSRSGSSGGVNAIEQIVVDRNGFDAAIERAERDPAVAKRLGDRLAPASLTLKLN